jgi:hypothetical protein
MLRVAPAIVVVSEIRFDRIFEGDGFDGGGAFGCVLGFSFGPVDLYRVDALLDFLTFFVSQLARLFERNCLRRTKPQPSRLATQYVAINPRSRCGPGHLQI